ncbi:MAG: monofunctional biosynthetic peptidoglycan transglycosylase [Bacteroidota bacterium]|nr:monofunctional biosynthetic peptidoglycan transglycosylase [Bacteroidota bacterium]MDP4230056.1 monofunctional biosynthetic peptidoglycan transglycosylase [Bacteroidota bacterium]MDP4237289.1 monofunctional biosynthetic peptidoglycan transglycosylase [Bacteroidota bacterium]
MSEENTTSQPKVRTSTKKFFSFAWKLALILLLVPVFQVLLLRFINPPITTMMIFRGIDHLFSGEPVGFSHTNLSWSEMPDNFIQAVVAAEDQRFYDHHGFDMTEIENAQREHAKHPNRPMRGASTISQQVAKNLFLPPWHSFIRKGIEAYYTVLIEFFWSKQRILQMYANIVELAPNVYGVEAGSEYHFHKPAHLLTASEASRLASVLPNPVRWSASSPSPYILRRSSRILNQMRGIPSDVEEDGEPD